MTELSGTHQAALAWRRPGVRVPSGPLLLPIDLQVKCGRAPQDRYTLQPYLTTVGTTPEEHVFQCMRGMVPHPGDHVGIGVQRDLHGSVVEEFLDELGVHVASHQQGRAGMTQARIAPKAAQRIV
jgi:hypothetical protein